MANGILKGKGTHLDPYLIEDAEDLKYVYKELRTKYVYYRQTNDIDCAGVTFEDAYILGAGYYNGYGHVIRNMHLEKISTNTSGNSGGGGGFANATWGSVAVYNLGFEGCSVKVSYINSYYSNQSGIGMILGSVTQHGNYTAIVQNCYARNCSIEIYVGGLRDGAQFHGAGGISGRLHNYSRITNCYFEGDISYPGACGGIVGSINKDVIVENCVSIARSIIKTTPRTAYTGYVGTVYGYAETPGNIINCYDTNDTQFFQGGVS